LNDNGTNGLSGAGKNANVANREAGRVIPARKQLAMKIILEGPCTLYHTSNFAPVRLQPGIYPVHCEWVRVPGGASVRWYVVNGRSIGIATQAAQQIGSNIHVVA
jgi:hypothetical protein